MLSWPQRVWHLRHKPESVSSIGFWAVLDPGLLAREGAVGFPSHLYLPSKRYLHYSYSRNAIKSGCWPWVVFQSLNWEWRWGGGGEGAVCVCVCELDVQTCSMHLIPLMRTASQDLGGWIGLLGMGQSHGSVLNGHPLVVYQASHHPPWFFPSLQAQKSHSWHEKLPPNTWKYTDIYSSKHSKTLKKQSSRE